MNKAVWVEWVEWVEWVDFIKLAIKEKNVETFKKDPKNSALLGGAIIIVWI